jgi:hypothetical protein
MFAILSNSGYVEVAWTYLLNLWKKPSLFAGKSILWKDALLQCLAVLQHVQHPPAAVEEFRRRLAPSWQLPPELAGLDKRRARKWAEEPQSERRADSPLRGGGGFPN